MATAKDQNRFVHAAVTGVTLLVFIIDALTPLGYAEWVFYFIPVALCVFQSNRQLPLMVVAVLMPLMLLGYWMAPTGLDQLLAVFKRVMAQVVGVGVGFARTVGPPAVNRHA